MIFTAPEAAKQACCQLLKAGLGTGYLTHQIKREFAMQPRDFLEHVRNITMLIYVNFEVEVVAALFLRLCVQHVRSQKFHRNGV